MLEKWKALRWEMKVVSVGFVILGFLITLGVAEKACALDLGSARPCRAIIGTSFSDAAGDTLRISYAELGATPTVLPRAYMVWTPQGEAFSVRRYFEGVAEPVWMAVPEGQSLVIPAPRPGKIGTTWTHVLAFKGTVTDSILVLPMD